jgi:Domain of unknown function (DUF4062)
MKVRYQVFLSSTFRDLRDERRKVFDVLMKMNHIPAGMELFPAADDEQFEFIKRVIDDCDYYVLIIGGRYGSVSEDGVSFTEKEYRYAISKGIKVISFLHEDPGKLPLEKSDTSEGLIEKLEQFRIEASKGRLVQFWNSPDDLASKVILGLTNAISSYPAVGWVRADNVPSEASAQESLRLRDELGKLKQKLEEVRHAAPEGIEHLAQGNDSFSTDYRAVYYVNNSTYRLERAHWNKVSLTWNQIFAAVCPALMHEAASDELSKKLQDIILQIASAVISKYASENSTEVKVLKFYEIEVWGTTFDTIVIQLKALGLIQKSEKARSLKDKKDYWTLTPFGDSLMTRLRAITKLDSVV